MSATDPPSKKARGASVGTKLALATAALMVLVSAGVYFALSRFLSQTLLTAKGEAAQEVGSLFASNVSAAVVFEDPDVIRDGLKHLAKNPDVTFAGVWAYGDDKPGEELGRYTRDGHKQRSSVVLADVSKLVWEADTLSVSVPVRDEAGTIIAHGLVEFSLATENAKIAVMRQRTLLTSVGVAAAVLLLLLVVSRRTVLVPLRRLQAGARQLGRGETAVFDIQSDDEVGALASALTQMAGRIREREEQIQRRNRDMRVVMDNVGQGFLTVNAQGEMSQEYSHILADWFGRPRPGEKFVTYLDRLDPKFGAWFGLAFDQLMEDCLPAELSLAQAPKRLTREGSTWNFEYRAIVSENERLEGVVVVISDVTGLLEKAAAERTNQEIIAALTRLRRDPQGYLDFLKEAEALVTAIETPESDASASVFRQIHTLKGICAITEVHSMVDFCHALEERHVDSALDIEPSETAELRQLWAHYMDRVGPLIASIDENGIFIEHGRYLAFVQGLESGRPRSDLLEEVRAWSLEDTGKALERLGQHARQLATRLGKADVVVEIESSGVLIPRGACSTLWTALVHAIRNAVDHGFEPPGEREASGKPARGTLRLATSWKGNDLVLSLSDDGRGIDWAAIAERAKDLGLPSRTKEDLEQALFSDRLTTKASATNTSGRGIGTAALKESLTKLGGRIEVESTPGEGTTFRFLVPRARIFDSRKPTARPIAGGAVIRIETRGSAMIPSLLPLQIPSRYP